MSLQVSEVATPGRCPHCGEAVPSETALLGGLEDGVTARQALDSGEEQPHPITLEGLPVAWIDRLLPRQPVRFLAVVVGLASCVWLAGLLLASDRGVFLVSREWRIQPLFLAGHLIALRLFVTVYTGNYLRGARHLTILPDEARRWVLRGLRPVGGIVSLLVATPFCVMDLSLLYSEAYRQYLLVPAQGIGAVDLLLAAIWCAEWIVNAYIWTLLTVFLVLLVWTIRQHPFRAPVEVVLHEKHYRPFLLMSVQGSTILLLFGLLYGVYVWYVVGQLSDYVGLGITIVILLIGFVPPWLMLRSQLDERVRRETFDLRSRLLALSEHRPPASNASRLDELASRMEEAVTMLRIAHLDRLQQELGQAEGRAVLMRVLVPASTILWKILRPLALGV